MSSVPQEAPTAAAFDAATIDWGDTDFEPVVTSRDYEPVRLFRMSHSWPQNPFVDRKFQLGGRERVALLEETVFVFWAHRFNKTHMGSAVNGTRRCTLERLGHCVACDHFDTSPKVKDQDGRMKSTAHCSVRKQTFGTNVLVFKTDLEGTLLDDQNNKLELHDALGTVIAGSQTPSVPVYEVFLWQFSSDKFVALRDIKKEWGSLKKQDIIFTLAPQKPETFQDFGPTISSKSVLTLLYNADAEKAKAMIEYYKEHKYDVPAILGKEQSDEEMLGFLGLGGTPPPGSGPTATTDVAQTIESELAKLTDEMTASAEPVAPPPPPADQPATQPHPVAAQTAPPEPTPVAPPAATPPSPPADAVPVVEDLDKLLELN